MALHTLIATERTELYPALARENLLLNAGELRAPVLYLWRGPRAVVMGKNQNPWRECNLAFLKERGLALARRVSGGGAVYHDPGNLNVSWILPREMYRTERLHRVLIRALADCGLEVEAGGSGALRAGTYKVSGSAYCYRKNLVLHHGTLLVDADLSLLRASLSPPHIRLKTHAVESVPARTGNLVDLVPGLTRAEVERALVREAEREFGSSEPLPEAVLSADGVAEEAERLRSADWLWGQTPRFRAELEVAGRGVLSFMVWKGRMREPRWNGESIEEEAEGLPFPEGEFGAIEREAGLPSGAVREAFEASGWVLEGV